MTHETNSITDGQIRQLRDEAGEAGDREQVAICDQALGRGPGPRAFAVPLFADADEARAECARVIADAAAQREEA